MKALNDKKISAAKYLESIMEINEHGVSEWYNVHQLNKTVTSQGYAPIIGNGSPVFQNDRGLGKKFDLEKSYDDKNAREAVRTIGFCSHYQQNRGITIPEAVRRHYSSMPCAMCGTTSRIQIDHKDGRKSPDLEQTRNEFQPLCSHCNGLKRERCKKCVQTNKRFNAQSLGYKNAFAEGGEKYQGAREGCTGCYMHDPRHFRSV